jgi:hypothetical protein
VITTCQKGAWLAGLVAAVTIVDATAEAQFRRGLFSETTEITVYPMEPPALLLPAGNIQVEVRNANGASARIVDRLNDLLSRQLTDNDTRLSVLPKGADVIVSATLIDWKEARRNSTKYVSEKRQVGTRQVKEKNGTIKTEPVYEYGQNRPSVVIDAAAGLRVEVRRGRGAPIADETVRHTIHEEHLADASPPTRDAVEDMLIDQVVQKGAGRVSPGRVATRVLVARSDDVDRLNSMAQNRRWQEWLTALGALRPHSDRKRDSYRLHNLAVAHEAIAYESTAVEDWNARLTLANTFIKQASAQNPTEKYITESADRIALNITRYQRLAAMYREVNAAPAPPARRTATPSTGGNPSTAPVESAASGATSPRSATMTNQDVIDLAAAGLDEDNLIAAIKDAKAVRFDLSAAGLKTLLGAKVSNRVITAMRSRAK